MCKLKTISVFNACRILIVLILGTQLFLLLYLHRLNKRSIEELFILCKYLIFNIIYNKMVSLPLFAPVGVTGQACGTIELIIIDIVMVVICFPLLVAGNTSKD